MSVASSLSGLNSTEGVTTVGTSYAQVLAASNVGPHDVNILNLGATEVLVKLTDTAANAAALSSDSNVYAIAVPPNTSRTIPNVQGGPGCAVFAKSSASNAAVYFDRSSPSDRI